MKALEGPCIVQPCVATVGYYLGAGQWICWLHAIENGWDSLLAASESQPTIGCVLPREEKR